MFSLLFIVHSETAGITLYYTVTRAELGLTKPETPVYRDVHNTL